MMQLFSYEPLGLVRMSGLGEWYEYLSIAADLIGFVGAVLLSYPFLGGQRSRDEWLAIDPERASTLEDRAALREARSDLTREILNRVHMEYYAAWIGAILIAIAFIGKALSAALPKLF
jgi:hypothetical protein